VFAIATDVIVAQDAAQSGSPLTFLLPLVILGGLFYVLLIMPQRRRQRKMEEMRSGIGVGDEVRTIGGILGTIVEETDDIVVLDIGGQHLRVV